MKEKNEFFGNKSVAKISSFFLLFECQLNSIEIRLVIWIHHYHFQNFWIKKNDGKFIIFFNNFYVTSSKREKKSTKTL